MSSRRSRALVSLLLFAMMSGMALSGAMAQESGMTVTVILEEYENSGFSGTAVLTETTGGDTHVSMELVGGELEGNHPTHIHTGTCDDFDPNPLYPLETVNLSPVDDAGISETDIDDVQLSELFDGEYVILVHKSPEELTNYLVCGEIGGGTLGSVQQDTPGSGSGTQDMPATGVGSSIENGISGSGYPLLFSVLALLTALAALMFRRTAK
jgi:hypothetical protein